MTLGTLSAGMQCEITEIHHCGGCGNSCHSSGHGQGHVKGTHLKKSTRAEEMGLRIGSRVEMLMNDGNQLVLLVDQDQIAIDQRMAMKIGVKI